MSLLLLFADTTGTLPPVVPIAVSEDPDHCFLAWNNLVDGAILSGGSWTAGLPLDRLKTRELARVARTTDVALASTQFDMDLGPDKLWRVLSLVNHNLSLSATYRVRAGADPTFATVDYDSGWLDVWPAVYADDELDWDFTNWWEGTYTAAEVAGYTPTLIHKLSAILTSRYVRVEISDPANVDSCVQIGRLFIANGWSPSHNLTVGASLGVEDDSEVLQAQGGGEFFNEKPVYRVTRFSISNIGVAEAYSKAFEIMRQAGVTKEVLFQWNPSDAKNAVRQSFVGRLRQLGPVEHPYPFDTSIAFEIQEGRR